ncbi:RHS repeat-associated core domain-containing protein [Massilia sp. NR 4-1]|uniref:RHS repeat-associated core domain-containing protein n=1 Tax=Massilia sp. NR 4-1 TaxID=1678028 RepID=UPI001680F4EC|nr:RHS repeat-associated core domain-containing protein [Massilia sp. NR 4-1]
MCVYAGVNRRLQWLCVLLLPLLIVAQAKAQATVGLAGPSLQKFVGLAPVARHGQSNSQLPDGRWLLLGGQGLDQEAVASIEILDPTSGKKEAFAGALLHARRGHSATLLPDGNVLVLGGVDSNGNVVTMAEVLNLPEGRSQALQPLPLIARTGHSATVLTDGRVLIAGGVDVWGRPIYEGEIYDPVKRQAESFNPKLESARLNHMAALLPTGEVLLWSGTDSDKRNVDGGELFDPGSLNFTSVNPASLGKLAAQMAALPPLALSASHPEAEAGAVAVDHAIALRFNQPMDVRSLSSASITLLGPHGTVALKVVPLEQGLLVFAKPITDLLPGSRYTLFIDGARDRSGVPLGFTSLGFTTARMAAQVGATAIVNGSEPVRELLPSTPVAPGGAAVSVDSSQLAVVARQYGLSEQRLMAEAESVMQKQIWQPDALALKGDWRAKRGISPLQKLLPLLAPPGETALAGQVLTMNGRGLRNVRLQIGGKTVLSDDTGRFLLRDIPAGVQILTIDGPAADKEATRYGYYQVRVDVYPGKTTVLDYTIWSSRLDPAGTMTIPSPTDKEIVLTSPSIPGLELRIPAGSVIRDSSGKIVTELNMTAIPVDRPPFPLPNADVPVYFTVQPGGASITSINTRSQQGARLIYPNFSGAAPGSRVDFWNYDARGKGWYVYGQGTVSPDGKQAIPDADVRVYEFTGAMISLPSNAPLEGPPPGGCKGGAGCYLDANQPPQPSCCAGDPVDGATGLFLHEATDLKVADVIPILVSRSYRPRDPVSRAFGIGTNLAYDYFLVGDTSPWTYQELILPDGGRLRYERISAGTNYADAVYQHTSSTTRYYGSTLRYRGGSCYWELKLKDGETVCFGESMRSARARDAAALSISDRNGNTLTLTRNNGNLVRIISPNGRQVDFEYDSSNRIIAAMDNAGRKVSYGYDAAGRLIKVTDPLGQTEVYTYDSAHNMVTVQDKRGNLMVANVYDANNRVSKQTYADGSTNLFNYTLNAANKVIQTDVTNERGIVKRIEFNQAGYPVRVTNALGLAEQQIDIYERDPLKNLLLSHTDALGRKTVYTYDERGNTLTRNMFAGTPAAVVTAMSYSSDYNQLLSSIDGLGRRTTLLYDSTGNMIEMRDGNENTVRKKYNKNGQLLELIDGEGNSTRFSYDRGDVSLKTDPLGRTTVFANDQLGRVQSVTDAAGNRTTFDLDSLDRTISAMDPNGGLTKAHFDENGNHVALLDAKLNLNKYGFNVVNLMSERNNSLGEKGVFQYDAGRNLIEYTDPKGQVTKFSYDGLNRVKEVVYFDGSSISYKYDLANRPTTIIDSVAGTIIREYDYFDNITKETTKNGSIQIKYNLVGQRISAKVLGQPVLNYYYDSGGRLVKLEQLPGESNNNATQNLTFRYDRNNRRISQAYPNGITRSNVFDEAGQLTAILYKKPDGSLLGDYVFKYDLSGNREISDGSFSRALISNEMNGVVNKANQLISFNGNDLVYDKNGNLINDGMRYYIWNARNQLVEIRNEKNETFAKFTYDGLGRRQGKKIGVTESSYLYDGMNIVQESDGSIPANVRANYIVGNVDEIFSQSSGMGSSARVVSYLTDAIGSVVRLTDGQGEKIVDYQYSSYGETEADAKHRNPFQYAGRENDGTGLYYYRARYYSPSMGRFIQSDPIGVKDGVNMYAYVNGNPISKTDPTGKFGIIGAAGNAVFDIGFQMMFQGRALSEINWWSVGISATAGFFGPGWYSVAKAAVSSSFLVQKFAGLTLQDLIFVQGTTASVSALLKKRMESSYEYGLYEYEIGNRYHCKGAGD